ncbi:MAG: tetratricopeptide repeat protein [Victivallales bacterium]|jgi:hypothetical protein
MSKKIDKDNLIEETYDEITQFEEFFVSHWPKILNVSVAVLILFALYMVFSSFSGKKELEASLALTNAKTVQELQKAISANPANPAANFARLKMAKLLAGEKKYDEAIKMCREITPVSNTPETYWQAKLDEGYLLELSNKKEEAAEAFSKVGADIKFPVSIRNEASFSAARIFLAVGKKDRALAAAKSMDSSPNAGDFWTEQAKSLIQQIN